MVLRGALHLQPGQFVQIMGDFVLGLKGKKMSTLFVRRLCLKERKKKGPNISATEPRGDMEERAIEKKEEKQILQSSRSPHKPGAKKTLAREGNT